MKFTKFKLKVNRIGALKDVLFKKFNFQNEIEFKKVNFGYIKEKLILKDINIKIKRGQTIGIIGASGSGKSTLVDLLVGLQKPVMGEILIDGLVDG